MNQHDDFCGVSIAGSFEPICKQNKKPKEERQVEIKQSEVARSCSFQDKQNIKLNKSHLEIIKLCRGVAERLFFLAFSHLFKAHLYTTQKVREAKFDRGFLKKAKREGNVKWKKPDKMK